MVSYKIIMRVLSVATTIFASLAFSAQAYACSCSQPSGWISEIAGDKIIFKGVAFETKINPENSKHTRLNRNDLVTQFNVSRDINGNLDDKITVLHQSYQSSCGLQFDLNRELWIIANKTPQNITVNSCDYQSDFIVEMIDFFETGKDVFIPPIWTCEALLKSNNPTAISKSGLTKSDCEYWSIDSQQKREKRLLEFHAPVLRGIIPDFTPPDL